MESNSVQIKEDIPEGSSGVNTGDIVFDTSSGFSVEEQQEILNRINSLSVEKGIVREAYLKTEAKKKGVLFPFLVNLGALLLLAGGFLFLWFSHGRDEQDIREASAVLGQTERKLIQEIRRETNRQLSEKEQEINDILSRLEDTDTEYQELQASVESLTGEQRNRAAYLLMMQDEYRATLSALRDDRAKILEDSRLREAGLRAQAEERVKELSSQIEQSQASLSAAMEELNRLSSEQGRIAAAEAQLGGYYTAVDRGIRSGDLDGAALNLKRMREFLNTSLFLGSRSLESRRNLHLAAVTSLEEILDEARRLKTAASSPAPQTNTENLSALEAQITSLEKQIEEKDRTITALGSEDADKGSLIANYEASLTELRSAAANQQQMLNQRDETIQTLRTENASSQQQVTELNTRLTQAQNQAQTDAQSISESRSRAAELETQNAELVNTNDDLKRQIDAVRQLLLQQ